MSLIKVVVLHIESNLKKFLRTHQFENGCRKQKFGCIVAVSINEYDPAELSYRLIEKCIYIRFPWYKGTGFYVKICATKNTPRNNKPRDLYQAMNIFMNDLKIYA